MTNEDINLAVAAKAGWTDIQVWNPSRTSLTYIGNNEAHPELGKFIPNYVEDLNAIAVVFRQLNLLYVLTWQPSKEQALARDLEEKASQITAPTEALALCKLLLAINPVPIKPQPKEATESSVVEVCFG